MKGCLTYLKDVSRAQAARQAGKGCSYQIVVRNHEIRCIPHSAVVNSDFKLGKVTESQCIHGFTSAEWTKISNRIEIAIQEKRL